MTRRIKKATWPDGDMLQFPLGLNTYLPDGEVSPKALQTLENAEGPILGAWQTRRGRTLFVTMPDAATPIMGLHELALVDGTTYLLMVQNGKLYRESGGSAVQIPIRRYAPYPPYPDNSSAGENLSGTPLEGVKIRASGAVGANLVASRMYRYAAHGVDASGTTTLSAQTATMQKLQGATPYPIDVNIHASYGCTSYVIWRSHSTDGGLTWSTWGRMATGVTATTTGGKTLIQWTDTGAVAPDTGVATPSTNTTEHILPTTQRVDWETADTSWNAENAAYFVNGDGFCRTNGTEAEIVTPTNPSTYLEDGAAGPGLNALADLTWAGHKARGLVSHHNNLFLTDIETSPAVFYYSRVSDPAHMPQLGLIQVSARGGRILDFQVKDASLAVGATTGFWRLLGTVFDPLGPSADVYLTEGTNIGLASEWSMVSTDSGMLQYAATDKRLRGITNLGIDKEHSTPAEVAEAIRPTLSELTDWDHVAGLWADDQWFLAFPADGQMLRLYERATDNGLMVSPCIDKATAMGALFRRKDGTILAAHATDGKLYKLFQSVYTDAGQAYTFRMKTSKMDGGDPNARKKWRYVRVYYFCTSQVTLNYRIETEEGVVESSVVLSGSGGYDDGAYDEATYDPWSAPFEEIDIGEDGRQIQITLWATGFIRINGLSFSLDYKR